MKIITVGAGFSGILLAYQIQKHCQNVEHVIYEKNVDIGGTWLENRYPGYVFQVRDAKNITDVLDALAISQVTHTR